MDIIQDRQIKSSLYDLLLKADLLEYQDDFLNKLKVIKKSFSRQIFVG